MTFWLHLFSNIVYGLYNYCFQYNCLSHIRYPVLRQQKECRKSNHKIAPINADNRDIVENKCLLNMLYTIVYFFPIIFNTFIFNIFLEPAIIKTKHVEYKLSNTETTQMTFYWYCNFWDTAMVNSCSCP